MDREGFRNRLKQYKKAREENPGLKYWEWKDIPKYDEGGEVGDKKVIPTQEEYIAEQIAARKAAALEKSRTRELPSYPLKGEVLSELQWLQNLNKREMNVRNSKLPQFVKNANLASIADERAAGYYNYLGSNCFGPTCAATIADNYGLNFVGSELFRQNYQNYGFKKINKPSPSDIVIDVYEGAGRHTMMLDENDNGVLRFNHSNGGFAPGNIRKNAKYPFKGEMESYTYTGTPADSTQWINDYKKIYGYAEGGQVEPDPLEVLERSRPKVAGIPINDKPLSGTDPIGELYLNLVSGNAVRKAIERGIDGMVRKSFYDNYKELLKAGWNRQRAYDYASPELGIDVLPGIKKGFDYVIKGANYTHSAKDFIE